MKNDDQPRLAPSERISDPDQRSDDRESEQQMIDELTEADDKPYTSLWLERQVRQTLMAKGHLSTMFAGDYKTDDLIDATVAATLVHFERIVRKTCGDARLKAETPETVLDLISAALLNTAKHVA